LAVAPAPCLPCAGLYAREVGVTSWRRVTISSRASNRT